MQSYKYSISMTPLNCQGEIEQLIANSLHTDWAIYVEYARFKPSESVAWNRWGKAHFALSHAEPVIDAINACRACHPNYHIRLYAEKFRPSTKLIYSVHTPSENFPGERAYITDKTLSPFVAVSSDKHRNYLTHRE